MEMKNNSFFYGVIYGSVLLKRDKTRFISLLPYCHHRSTTNTKRRGIHRRNQRNRYITEII